MAEEGKYSRTPSGVPYEDLAPGGGPPAEAGDDVVIDYVLRRSNGYFIYGTVEGVSFQPLDVPTEPFRVRVGDPDVIPGLSDALVGVRAGGKRRALIPPALGYAGAPGGDAKAASRLQPQPPTFATRRQLLNHTKEPLLFEIQVVKVAKPKRP